MKNVVTIGGGTGSYTVLSGIKTIPDINISAIVSMADDGGTNGMLRSELGVLPPSDARQCLVALAEDEALAKMMDYRFDTGTLSGQNFGSILIAVLEKTMGDFSKAIAEASRLLKIRGKVIPVTLDNAELGVTLNNGESILGEDKIGNASFKNSQVKEIFYKNPVKLNEQAQQALLEADFIIICPGDFFTSIVPNLIVDGFKDAISRSKAEIIAVENLGNAESDEYRRELPFYLGKTVNYFIPGDETLVSKEQVVKHPTDMVKRSLVRHDSKRLAHLIAEIINK